MEYRAEDSTYPRGEGGTSRAAKSIFPARISGRTRAATSEEARGRMPRRAVVYAQLRSEIVYIRFTSVNAEVGSRRTNVRRQGLAPACPAPACPVTIGPAVMETNLSGSVSL